MPRIGAPEPLEPGNLNVDAKTGSFRNNPVLENQDFNAAAGGSAVGRFAQTATLGWYRALLKNTAYPLVNLTGSTQFRLRFATDDNDDLGADYLSFYSGDTIKATDRPELIVTYYVP